MIKITTCGLSYPCDNCSTIGNSYVDIMITEDKDNTIVFSLCYNCRIEMIKVLIESLKNKEEEK